MAVSQLPLPEGSGQDMGLPWFLWLFAEGVLSLSQLLLPCRLSVGAPESPLGARNLIRRLNFSQANCGPLSLITMSGIPCLAK